MQILRRAEIDARNAGGRFVRIEAQLGQSVENTVERVRHLHAGEVLPHTDMRASTERIVLRAAAMDVVLVRVFEQIRIAVRRRTGAIHDRTGRDVCSSQRRVVDGRAQLQGRRAVPP